MSKVKAVMMEELLEKELIESKQLFKTVFEHSPAAIIVMDTRQRIVVWNPMVEKMLGKSRADLFNQPVSSLYAPKEWKRIRLMDLCRREVLSNISTKVYHKDGTLLDVGASLSVLKDYKGKMIGFMGIFLRCDP